MKAQIIIPKGYRLLKWNETVEKGDRFLRCLTYSLSFTWSLVVMNIGNPVLGSSALYIRKKQSPRAK